MAHYTAPPTPLRDRPTFQRLTHHVAGWTAIHAVPPANPSEAFYSASRAHVGMDQGTAVYRGPPKDSPVQLGEAMRAASSSSGSHRYDKWRALSVVEAN
jgi:hypothetical protein